MYPLLKLKLFLLLYERKMDDATQKQRHASISRATLDLTRSKRLSEHRKFPGGKFKFHISSEARAAKNGAPVFISKGFLAAKHAIFEQFVT
jgi:hypothetical protein